VNGSTRVAPLTHTPDAGGARRCRTPYRCGVVAFVGMPSAVAKRMQSFGVAGLLLPQPPRFLGADVPVDELASLATDLSARAVGVSVSLAAARASPAGSWRGCGAHCRAG